MTDKISRLYRWILKHKMKVRALEMGVNSFSVTSNHGPIKGYCVILAPQDER